MHPPKLIYFLLLGAFMLTVNPFIGFNVFYQNNSNIETNILVKAFSIRKQEYVDESDYDYNSILQRLARPYKKAVLLLAALLDALLPFALCTIGSITNRTLASIRYSLLPKTHQYLLIGALLI